MPFLFMSKGQAKALAQLVVSGNTDKKAYKGSNAERAFL